MARAACRRAGKPQKDLSRAFIFCSYTTEEQFVHSGGHVCGEAAIAILVEVHAAFSFSERSLS